MKKKIKKSKSIILFILVFMSIGFLIGYVEDKRGLDFNINEINIILEIFLFVIFSFIAIIIHESGHLIGGLLTGYKFLSFRIGNLMLVYNKGQFRLVEYAIMGTGGQCLLVPPELDENEEFPYKLYNLGGSILNILIGIIFMTICIFSIKLNFFIFGIINTVLGFVNIIPMEKIVANDGLNQRFMKEDKDTRLYFWKMLKINALLFNHRFKDMDDYLFSVKNTKNHMSQGIVTAKINRFMDFGEYEKAKELCEEILLYKNLNIIQKQEIISELIFLNIILGNKDKAIELYSEDIKKYIKITQKYFISKKRLLYSYYLIIERDFDKSAIILEEFNKTKGKYPYKGEVLMEDELIYKANEVYENLI